MNEKAALSIQTIIIAAVGILVLSVLAYLIIGAGQDTEQGIGCASQGGICGDCDGEVMAEGEDLCPEAGERCCQPLAVDTDSSN